MKKFLSAAILISILLLSGCFGFLKREKEVKPAAQENANRGQVITEPDSSQSSGAETKAPSPPSFQDGDYYLQALANGDLEACRLIQNSKLKDRCESEVKSRARGSTGSP